MCSIVEKHTTDISKELLSDPNPDVEIVVIVLKWRQYIQIVN